MIVIGIIYGSAFLKKCPNVYEKAINRVPIEAEKGESGNNLLKIMKQITRKKIPKTMFIPIKTSIARSSRPNVLKKRYINLQNGVNSK